MNSDESKVKAVVVQATKAYVNNLNISERQRLLVWLEEVQAIRNSKDMSTASKLRALAKIDSSHASKTLYIKLFETIKNKVWTNQSWARRLAFAGAATGITLGGGAVGIATMGAGMAVPLTVMTAAGGIILGAAIDELNKEL